MSNHEATTWTALPNNIIGDVLRLSVFVSPRLFGPFGTYSKLGNYQAFLNWPSLVKDLRFDVYFEQGGATKIFPAAIPVNKGEFAVDPAIWEILFNKETLVTPIDPPGAAIKDKPRTLDGQEANTLPEIISYNVYYRAQVFNSLVNETLAVQYRAALFDLEGEPRRPTITKTSSEIEFDVPDRLLDLAAAGAIDAPQFAQQGEDGLVMAPADSLQFIFGKVEDFGTSINQTVRNSITRHQRAHFEALDGSQLGVDATREFVKAFSGYHRRGIVNKRQQIRSERAYKVSDPRFTTMLSDTPPYFIIKKEHGSDFDFAESTQKVMLPTPGEDQKGFEIVISYSPNEAIPDRSNFSTKEEEEKWKAAEAAIRYESDLIVVGNDNTAQILDDSGRLVREYKVPDRRPKRFRWAGRYWIPKDANLLDFNSVISAISDYPAMIRRLGMVFDIEIEISKLKNLLGLADFSGVIEGKVWIVPQWANIGDKSIPPRPIIDTPKTRFTVGESEGVTANGISITSFSASSKQEASVHAKDLTEPVGAGMRSLAQAAHYGYDLDISSKKLMHKAVSEADPNGLYFSTDRVELPGSPRSALLTGGHPSAAIEAALRNTVDLSTGHRSPALRSTGISLFSDREYALFQDATDADKMRQMGFLTRVAGVAESDEDDDLFLNDVVAGYIIDVFDEYTGRWWSLCERQLVFVFKDPKDPARLPYLSPADEGWISIAPEVETDEKNNKQLRTNENFFRWDGSSLIAPPPRKVAPVRECLPGKAETPFDSPNLTVSAEHKPLSLPQLRFGRTYRFRARTADLAGNAWPLEYANALDITKSESPSIAYKRFDPINPPFFVPLDEPQAGDTMPEDPDACKPDEMKGFEKGEMLAVRSDLSSPAIRRWAILPPEVKLQEATWMGMLDGFADPDRAFAILRRYCGTLPKGFVEGFLEKLRWPDNKKLFSTPYLPDIYASAAAFCYMPGGTERDPTRGQEAVSGSAKAVIEKSTIVDFLVDSNGPAQKSRPYSQPFVFELRGGDKRRTSVNDKTRTLEVTLPPGEQQIIRVSSAPPPDLSLLAQVDLAFKADQDQFILQHRGGELGIADWTKLVPYEDQLTEAINRGQFWPISPKKNLTLIHTVIKPVVPTVKGDESKREFRFSDAMKSSFINRVTLGRDATLHDPGLRVHRTSTSRIDVYAEWNEHFDGAGEPEFPRLEKRTLHCFYSTIPLPDLTIAPDESHLTFDLSGRHDYPSTKHYAVRYHMIATTRYREYYDPELTKDPAHITIRSEDSRLIHVLNTVPPPPPDVVYVLPLFIWEKPVEGEGKPVVQTLRRGLRVYMRRNWFSTGEDERLAVVFAPEGSTDDSILGKDKDYPFPVTHWGTNPIWLSKPVYKQPTVNLVKTAIDECPPTDLETPLPESFQCKSIEISKVTLSTLARRAGGGTNRTPAQISPHEVMNPPASSELDAPSATGDAQTVDISVHTVFRSNDKDLIYSGIEFESPNSYSPLIRLSLCRYQHFSTKLAHLSPPQSWMFVPMSNNRSLTVGRVGDECEIRVVGIAQGNEKEGFRENKIVLAMNGVETLDAVASPIDFPIAEAQGGKQEETDLSHWRLTFPFSSVAPGQVIAVLLEKEMISDEERTVWAFDIGPFIEKLRL